MVISLAALAGKSVLSPLQGLGFGFGYGYGVRLGYHSFKPSKSATTTAMRLSPEPTTAGVGMGLGSAEEITAKAVKKSPLKGLTHEPTVSVDPNEKKYANKGHSSKPATNQASLKADKSTYKRMEGGAIVAVIDKNKAKKMMFYAGQPTDDRTTRRHFIKGLYPFTK